MQCNAVFFPFIGYTRVLVDEFIIALGIVILMKVIHLDDIYQRLRINGIGGIACSFQTACPAFIIGVI